MNAQMNFRKRIRCPECNEHADAAARGCYCEELQRRNAYDSERERKGLVALYRPPSMR
jgi:hypothetical protein